MAFSDKLASLMREATTRKSQRRIAQEADISQTTVGNMVMGRIPSKDVCLKVADASDIDHAQMLIACGYQPETVIDLPGGGSVRMQFEGPVTDDAKKRIIEYALESAEEADADPEDREE